jgi:hypothetical protein
MDGLRLLEIRVSLQTHVYDGMAFSPFSRGRGRVRG